MLGALTFVGNVDAPAGMHPSEENGGRIDELSLGIVAIDIEAEAL